MWLIMLMHYSEVDKSVALKLTLCMCVPFLSRNWLRCRAVSRIALAVVSPHGRTYISKRSMLTIRFILHTAIV
jgi:hypothetical protein